MIKLIVTSLTAFVVASPEARAARREKPNIIYIMLDDAGWGDFGAFGTADPIALYDFSKDPGEKTDIAKDNPKVVAEMKRIMDTSRTETPFRPAVEKGKKKR